MGGVWLVAWASGEVARPWFNVWAGPLDVIVGATALPLAWWVSSGSSIALAIAVAWNLLGLLDMLVGLGLDSIFKSAGPTYMLSLKTPVVAALKPRIIGIVTIGVPLMIMVHILSLWQLLGGH